MKNGSYEVDYWASNDVLQTLRAPIFGDINVFTFHRAVVKIANSQNVNVFLIADSRYQT